MRNPDLGGRISHCNSTYRLRRLIYFFNVTNRLELSFILFYLNCHLDPDSHSVVGSGSWTELNADLEHCLPGGSTPNQFMASFYKI
jgi:hypothetical protein